MKILIISDFSLEQNPGGAQVSNDAIIRSGIERGHSIELMTHSCSPTLLLQNYDIIVSSNLESIYQKDSTKHVLNTIINHPYHVRLEHDSCSYLSEEDRRLLFDSAKISFFLSEFHIDFFRELYGDYFQNVFISYDPIDTSIFCKKESQLKYDVVYCGFLHPLKGIESLVGFAKSNKSRDIAVFGWPEQVGKEVEKMAQNIEYKGRASHEEIASIFQSSKAIYHSPLVREPFCRMVGEALLCGVEEVIGATEKIGSYLEFRKYGRESFEDRCNNAENIFWQELEKRFNNG